MAWRLWVATGKWETTAPSAVRGRIEDGLEDGPWEGRLGTVAMFPR